MKGSLSKKPDKVILLIGKQKQVFLSANKRDQVNKHLYSYNGQLYSGWAFQGGRCRTTFYGKYIDDCTIFIYGEDCIHPHIEKTWDRATQHQIGNSAPRFQQTIKEERAGNVKNPKKTAGVLTKINPRKNWPYILIAVALIGSLLLNGGKI